MFFICTPYINGLIARKMQVDPLVSRIGDKLHRRCRTFKCDPSTNATGFSHTNIYRRNCQNSTCVFLIFEHYILFYFILIKISYFLCRSRENSGTAKTFLEFCFYSESCVCDPSGCCCYGWFSFHVKGGRRGGGVGRCRCSLFPLTSGNCSEQIQFRTTFPWFISRFERAVAPPDPSQVGHVSFTDHIAGGRGELLLRCLRLWLGEPHNGHLPATWGGGAAARRSSREHPDHQGLGYGSDTATVKDIWTLDDARPTETRGRYAFWIYQWRLSNGTFL